MNPVAEPPVKSTLTYWILFNMTVFVAAACIMVVEILSTRMVAQYLGSSLYTWTTAIGVVLGGISLGNFLGGRLADRLHPRRTLSLLFVLSSVACLTIPVVNHWVGGGESLEGYSWPTRIFLHFVATFLLPATLLGTMGPIVAKMALDLDVATGRTIGSLYAWGSIGSIFGTFLAGFFLIAWFGIEASILCVSGILALVGLLYGYRSWYPYAGGGVFAAALVIALAPWAGAESLGVAMGWRTASHPDVLLDEDTQYQRVRILKDGTARTMVLDVLLHSRIDLAHPNDLIYGYEKIYAAVLEQTHRDQQPMSAMFIGGGGYVFPGFVERHYPGSFIEVSEIDPVVTEAAFEWFGLREDSAIESHDMDARNRVTDLIRRKRAGEEVPRFDYVFGDAFSDFSIPFHLTTREFNEMVRELMVDDGVYMLNLIDTWSVARFLSAVVHCLKQTFEEVYVISASANMTRRNTFVILSSDRPLRMAAIEKSLARQGHFSGHVLSEEEMSRLARINGELLLTDDYAPVENLLLETVRRRSAIDTERVLAEVERRLDRGEFILARGELDAALERDPHDPELLNKRGFIAIREGDFATARDCFVEVVEYDPRNRVHRTNLGLAYERLGQPARAVEQYRSAADIEPDHVPTLNALALLLATTADDGVRDAREAVRWARQLCKLTDYRHPRALDTLAVAYASDGQYPQAIAQARKALELAESADMTELAAQIRAHLVRFENP